MRIRKTRPRRPPLTPRVIHGDCLQKLPEIKEHTFDLILCDLPYGQTAPSWDKIIPMATLWREYKRLIKPNGVIALFAAQPFTTMLIHSNIKQFKYCWYWVKNQGTNFFHAKRMPIRHVEEICVFGGKKYNPQMTEGHAPTQAARGQSQGRAYHGTNKRDVSGGKTTRYPKNVLEFKIPNNYKRLHPSQKPTDLLEYIIRTYTDEGDLVLDNCAGSGSTGVACQNTRRRFVLIEKDETYYQTILTRLERDHE